MFAAFSIFSLCAISLIELIEGVSLPNSIPKCRRSDPQFSECFQKSATIGKKLLKNGNRTLGLQKIEPLYIPKMSLGDSGTSQQIQIIQNYEDIYIHGINSSTISETKVEFSSENCYWSFVAHTPKVRMEANYTLKGQILVFPINGHGKGVIEMENVKAIHQMKCQQYKRGGKTYFMVKEYELEQNVGDIHFHFENIIHDNKQLSEEVERVINENGLDIYSSVQSGFDKSYGLIFANMINGFFSKVSEDELFLD